MLRRDASIGGEQSGHMIFRQFATTGDGMLTALRILETTVLENATLDSLAADLIEYPQLLVNVRVKVRKPARRHAHECRMKSAPANWLSMAPAASSSVSPEQNRSLVSMVEAQNIQAVESWANRIADTIRAELT